MNSNFTYFSYWIYLWYLAYMIFQKKIPSPKIAIICAIIHNLYFIVCMIIYKLNLRRMILFILLMLIMKIIPYYTIRNETICTIDYNTLALIIIIYCSWLKYYKNMNIFQILIYNHKFFTTELDNSSGMAILNRVLTRLAYNK